MRRLISMISGILVNVLALFSALSAEEIKANLDQHYQNAMQAGRDAAAAKRLEMEQEIVEMEQNH